MVASYNGLIGHKGTKSLTQPKSSCKFRDVEWAMLGSQCAMARHTRHGPETQAVLGLIPKPVARLRYGCLSHG